MESVAKYIKLKNDNPGMLRMRSSKEALKPTRVVDAVQETEEALEDPEHKAWHCSGAGWQRGLAGG
eukprot:7953786-Alexandrium_andersonii.AAC.1